MSQINVNTITNRTGSGGPVISGLATAQNGLHVTGGGVNVTGIVTATTFSGSVETLNIDSVGIITAQSGVHFGLVGSGLTISSVDAGTSMGFFTDGSEALRIDSSGRLLVGTSTALTKFFNNPSVANHLFQIETTEYYAQSLVAHGGTAPTGGCFLTIGRSRGTTAGSTTLVASGDLIGSLNFQGADGSEFVEAANIKAEVDGTPGTNDMPGRLVFSTNSGSTSPTERMRITSDAYVRLASGTGGIQFNGDTAAANALDDYEEGTWTPVIQGLSNTPTYSNITGSYTKVGRLVHLKGFIQIAATTPTYTNDNAYFTLGGIPFTAANNQGYLIARSGGFSCQSFGYSGAFNEYGATGQVATCLLSTTTIGFSVNESNGVRGNVKNSGAKSAFILEFDLTYFT